MLNFFKKSCTLAFGIISAIFTFVPESLFEKNILPINCTIETNIILNRILLFITIFIFSILGTALYLKFRKTIVFT